MTIKGAIFDLDGTLLDSMSIWDNVCIEYLDRRSIPVKGDIRKIFRSFSLYQAANYYISEYGITDTPEKVMSDINKLVEDFYLNDAPVKKGAAELLELLKSKGVQMCIATATDRYQVEAALKRNGIFNYFKCILTCTEVGSGKDRPDIFYEALESIGTSKSDTLVFEDSLYAITTLNKEGFHIAGVYDSYEKHNKDNIRSLSDIYLDELREMERYL